MIVLVTGGLGYIGSHTVLELYKNNHEVVIVDNLNNSSKSVLKGLNTLTHTHIPFYEVDVCDYYKLKTVSERYLFDAIIHFAGYKAVGESVSNPIMYYHNNLTSTLNISKLAVEMNIKHIIFSSSATVYGNGISPFKEESPLLPRTNPYGETKAMSERILIDSAKAYKDLHITLLRYFNPVGADSSHLIGENPKGVPNNLMPYITQVAKGLREKLYVYGNDYDTPDGTGVRDYIHVTDLAIGHVKALEKVIDKVNIYNLGTGKGTSVLELIETFKKVNRVDISYEMTKRREGDIAISYADSSKAERLIGFKTTKTIEDMVYDSYKFELNIKKWL
jgi:UDP-glucose 4-epimerase